MKSKDSKRRNTKELSNKIPQKDSKQKSKKEIEEEENIPPIPKPFNIERFIYISSYSDSNLMSNLNQLFEEINQTAFNFPSEKEIYTYDLSQEEQENNELDYISGFQIIDKKIRITILEGLTGKGMAKIKETLPKSKLNDENVKILSDSNVLFDTRIYSKFNLSLKLIKLSYNLEKYLQTYTIYENANRNRQIYDCFQNLASILRVETLEEVNTYNIFPSAESLLLMERKHGDMITPEDLTGIFKERKKVTKVKLLSDKNSSMTNYSNMMSNNSNIENEGIKINLKKNNKKKKKISVSKSQDNINYYDLNRSQRNKQLYEDMIAYQEKLKNIHKLILKPKTDSKNEIYEKYLEEKKNINLSRSQIWENNIKHIEKLKKEIPTYQKFCRPCKPGEEIIQRPNQILFCPTKRNYFDALVKKMREKYIKDTKHHYSYSNYSLSLSFPMIETGRNEKYIKYLENKKRWKNNKDFERYKQPEREKYFFPKIHNIL